ncbi:Uma2 family endonuclease [Leptolyngbya sp. FACHB-17]|uniref:Uma2 family endonuclease n=1 Tax=unclassified Leptolyngbya TaxID=2650499 RepID=UPI001680C697|nr:Uma2 family endonuclease [Leptolyngbya sp. FACHB-17]MBD2083108.1 Uma2 family endonuclease [Leptolyngbya sp. FACHB-17]
MNTPVSQIPPLENGARLSRPEFERRYPASNIKEAELIEGIVYVASPLRFESHAEPHSNLSGWAGIYKTFTPRVRLGNSPTLRLDLDNEPQPDLVMFLERDAGERVGISADGYLEGAPELIIEVAASSAAIDSGSKKRVYRRNGVQEYIIWQSYEKRVDWFQLVEGEYRLMLPDETGIIRSSIFPGLWLSVEALLGGDMITVLETVQAGVRSPEHQAFINRQ